MRLAIGIGTAFGLLVVITVAVFHATAKQAQACSAPAIPLEVLIANSDSIFRGQVISIDSVIVNSDEYQREVEAIMSHGGVEGTIEVIAFEDIVEFRATEVWKGEPYETAYVRSTWERVNTPVPMPCPGNHFYATNARYLVFARDGQANVGFTTATRKIDSGPLPNDLAGLGIGKTPIPGSVGPIPERKGQPVVYERSGSGCSLTPGYALGSINLSVFGLAGMLAWFWIRQRFRR